MDRSLVESYIYASLGDTLTCKLSEKSIDRVIQQTLNEIEIQPLKFENIYNLERIIKYKLEEMCL